MNSDWRIKSQQIIDGILRNDSVAWNMKLAVINKSYPFGARENHPYQIWLSEVKRAKIAIRRKCTLQEIPKKITKPQTAPDQLTMWD